MIKTATKKKTAGSPSVASRKAGISLSSSSGRPFMVQRESSRLALPPSVSNARIKQKSQTASGAKLVRFSAASLPIATKADLKRLRALSAGKATRTSVVPKFDSMIRRALLEVLRTRSMNAYQLWKAATAFAPQLQRTAVYQFLAGKRQVGIEYAEALMRAAGLTVDASHNIAIIAE